MSYMQKDCYWITKTGIIIRPASIHILTVVKMPEIFEESNQSLIECFERHGEPMLSNIEGAARVEILTRILKRNFIRIRNYGTRRSQHWSIQLHTLTEERQAILGQWANYLIQNGQDRFADVILHQLQDNSKIQTTLEKIIPIGINLKIPYVMEESVIREVKRNVLILKGVNYG